MNAAEKIAKAREALILDQRFFGNLIWAMPVVLAGQVRGQRIDTAATDYARVYFNPDYIDTLTLGEVKGLYCHEVLHPALGHNLRRNGRDPLLWNVAGDYAINPMILAAGMILPKGALINPAYARMSAEEIYVREAAKANAKQAAAPQQKAAQGLDQDGKGDDAAKDDNAPDKPQDASQDDAGQDQGQGDDDKPDFSKPGLVLDAINEDGSALSDADKREAEADMQVRIIQAATIATKAGQDAAGFERLVKDAKNPREDWVEVLRRFIQQNVQTQADPTWSKLNRRAFALGTMLPGRTKEDAGDLLIAIDTSGSMDELLVGKCIAELKAILEDTNYETVTVMACDACVHWHATFAKGEEPVIRVPGGDGTAFFPVWHKADALGLTPRACVYFTDLDCYEFGEEPEYPVLWAQWGSYPAKPPFGEVVKVELA